MDRQHHARGGAKDGVGNAAIGETGSAIEPQRVRVGCHLQALHASRSQNLRDAVDERSDNPTPPPAQIHEQVVQLQDPAGLDPRGEPNK